MSIDQENTLSQEQTDYVEIPAEIQSFEINALGNTHISVHSSQEAVGKFGSNNIKSTQPNNDRFCIELDDEKEPTFIDISLPEGKEFNLRINLSNGSVDILNTTGNLEINADSFEEITVTGHRGEITITENENEAKEGITLRGTESESVTIQTHNSDINLERINTKSLFLYTTTGGIKVTEPNFAKGGILRINNTFGQTRLFKLHNCNVIDQDDKNIFPPEIWRRPNPRKNTLKYSGFRNCIQVLG